MPIYEYKCQNCGYKFEKIQSFNASSQCECPHCHKKAKRLISQASFVLKGTGWYVTDHPSKARKEGMRKEKSTPIKPSSATSSSTPAAASSTSKTDSPSKKTTKPASKTKSN
jgi:putative FmdB family regulatory protein